MKQPITIRLRDLGLAAALVSVGYEVSETFRDENGRTYFVFLEEDGLKRDIDSYWSDTLVVRARKINDNTRILKSLIYAEK